jgi:hypothetical protein
MDLSKLTDGLNSLKDGLGGDLENLGSEVFEGKTSVSDAFSQEKDNLMNKAKGLFGSDENADADKKDDDTDDDSKDDTDDDDKDEK